MLTVSTVKTADCEITAMLDAMDMAGTVIAVQGEEDPLLPVALRYAERIRKPAVAIGPTAV